MGFCRLLGGCSKNPPIGPAGSGVEGNPVFSYLNAFDPDQSGLETLKAHYRKGGLGDMAVKRRLLEVLLPALEPIRDRRRVVARDPGQVMELLREGTEAARAVAARTLQEVRGAMHLDY